MLTIALSFLASLNGALSSTGPTGERLLTCLLKANFDGREGGGERPYLLFAVREADDLVSAVQAAVSTQTNGTGELAPAEADYVADVLKGRLARIPEELRVPSRASLSALEERAVKGLRARVSGILPLELKSYQGSYWDSLVDALRALIMNENPLYFRRWTLILASFELFNPVQAELAVALLKTSPDYHTRYRHLCDDKGAGGPAPFPGAPAGMSQGAAAAASMVALYESAARRRIDDTDLVVEFGGGYGLLVHGMIKNLAFDGWYIIFDTPIMGALQYFFMELNGIAVTDSVDEFLERRRTAMQGGSSGGVLVVSSVSALRRALEQSGYLAETGNTFVAHWSLSEAPTELREEILGLVKTFDHFFLSYQDTSRRRGTAGGWNIHTDNNRDWFTDEFRGTVEEAIRGGEGNRAKRGGLHDALVWTEFRHPFEVYASGEDRVVVATRQRRSMLPSLQEHLAPRGTIDSLHEKAAADDCRDTRCSQSRYAQVHMCNQVYQ